MTTREVKKDFNTVVAEYEKKGYAIFWSDDADWCQHVNMHKLAGMAPSRDSFGNATGGQYEVWHEVEIVGFNDGTCEVTIIS